MSTRTLAAQSRVEVLLQLRRGENLIVTLAVPLGILVFFAKVDTTIPKVAPAETACARASVTAVKVPCS